MTMIAPSYKRHRFPPEIIAHSTIRYHRLEAFDTWRAAAGKRLSVDRYRRLVKEWIALARLDPSIYGSHSLRRTRVAHIYRKTANLRVAQVLLGHKTIENTARYLGIEEEQAMEVAEQFEI